MTGGWAAGRPLADRLRVLADQVEAGAYVPPARPDGYRGLVVTTVVHDLVCTGRVVTRQDTVPAVSHCADCGLSVPIGTEPGDVTPPDPAEVLGDTGDQVDPVNPRPVGAWDDPQVWAAVRQVIDQQRRDGAR